MSSGKRFAVIMLCAAGASVAAGVNAAIARNPYIGLAHLGVFVAFVTLGMVMGRKGE